MGDAIPLEAMAYAEEGALDGGAIILVPQEDVQSVLLGESLLGGGGMEGGPGHQLVLGQLQPLHLEGSPHQMATGPLVFAPVAHHHQGAEEDEEDVTMTTLSPACLSPSLVEQQQQQQQAAECSPLAAAAHHYHQQPQQQPSGPPLSSPASAAPPERTVSQALKVRWLDELLASKGIRCPIPDCPTVCTSITAMQKHYAHCPGVNGSGLDQCPYCEAQFLSKSSALHVHVVEVHPTRRSLMHSTFEGTPRKPLPYRRRCPEDGPSARSLGRGRARGRAAAAAAAAAAAGGGPSAAKRAAMGGRAPGPYPGRGAAAGNRTQASGGLPPSAAGAVGSSLAGGAPQQPGGGAGGQWDWEQKRRTYSRSWGEPMGPTSELFRRGAGGGGGGGEEEDPLQLPRSVLNRSGVTLSSEELALNEHQLQEGSAASASAESGELCGGEPLELETPTPETIRLDSLPNILRKGSGRGAAARRFVRNRYPRDNVRTMQVIVKSAPGTEGASALLRNPRVLQTLGDLAVNAAAAHAGGGSPVAGLLTSTSVQPLSPHPQVEEDEPDDQAVVAVHSAATPDGRYLQVEQALKPPAIRPSDVDRFFLKRVDCSCQTDDLPPLPPPPAPAAVRPELPPGTVAPPAILKRTRLLAPAGHQPPAKGPGKPLAVSIVCSSHASSSDEEDNDDASAAHAGQQQSPPAPPPAPTEPLPTAQPPAEPSPEQSAPPTTVQQLSPAAIQAAVEQALAGLQSGQPMMLQQLQAGQSQAQLPGSFMQAMVLPSMAGQLGGALQQQQGLQVFAIQMPDGQGPAIAIMQTPELQQALGDMAGLAQLLAGVQPIAVLPQAGQLSSEGATPIPEPLSGPQAVDQPPVAQPEAPLHPAPTPEAILPEPLTETVFPRPFPSQQEEAHVVAVPPPQLPTSQALGDEPGASPAGPPPSQQASLQELQARQPASGEEPLAPPAAPSEPVASQQSMEQRPPTPPVVSPDLVPSEPQVPSGETMAAQPSVCAQSGPDSSLAEPLPTLQGVDEPLGLEQGDVQQLPLVTSSPPAAEPMAQHPAEQLSQPPQPSVEQADAQKAAVVQPVTEEPMDQEPAAHMLAGAWHTQEHQYASAQPNALPEAQMEAVNGAGMAPQVAEGAGRDGGEAMDEGEPTAPDGPQVTCDSGLLVRIPEQATPATSSREDTEQEGLAEQDREGSDHHECAEVQPLVATQERAVEEEEEEPLGPSQEGVDVPDVPPEQPEPTLQQEPLKGQESSPEQVVPQQDGASGSSSSDSSEGRGTVEVAEAGLGVAVDGAPPGSSSQGSHAVSLEACRWPDVPAVAQEQCSDPVALQPNAEPSGETEGGQTAYLEQGGPPASQFQDEGVEQGVDGDMPPTKHVEGAQVEQEDSGAHLEQGPPSPNPQEHVNEDGATSVGAPAVAVSTAEEPVEEVAAQVVPSLIHEQDEGSEESVAPAALQHSVPLEADALGRQVVYPAVPERCGSVGSEASLLTVESSECVQPPAMSADQISQRAQIDAGSSQAHIMHVLVPSLDDAPGMEGGLGDSAREAPQARCVPSGDIAAFAAAAPDVTEELQIPCRNEDRPIEARLLLSMPEGVPCPDAPSRASLVEEAVSARDFAETDEGAQVVPECAGQNGRTTEETARPAASPQQTAVHSEGEASPESVVASPSPQGVKKPPDDKLQVVPESARGDGAHTEPAAKRARHAEDDRENGQEEEDEEAMDVDDRPSAGQRDVSGRDEIFMDDADSASSCEALHIVESVPEEETTRGTGARAAGDESQEERADDGNVAGHFLVVSGGRRVAASTCAHIPVQLVLSRGPQLKQLACSVTCRAVRRPPVRVDGGWPTLEFTIGLSPASSRPLAKVRSRSGAVRVVARRQRPRRFQLRVKSSLLPHQPARTPTGRRPSKRSFTIVLNGGGVGAESTPPWEPGDNVEKPGDDPAAATGAPRQDGAGADHLGCTARGEPAANSGAPRASEPSGSSSPGASGSGCPSGGNQPGQPPKGGPEDTARPVSSEPRIAEEQEGEEEGEERGSQDVQGAPEELLQSSQGVLEEEEEGAAVEQQLQVPAARRRGRPPKGKPSAAPTPSSSGDSPEPAPKKRRGRPPKALPAANREGQQGPGKEGERTACNGPPTDCTAEGEGPPSRPNKEPGAAAASSSLSTDEAGTSENKASPGRHRADSSRMEEAAFSPGRRSSGRKQSLATEGPLVCSACGQSFSRKEEASEHILRVHYNVALINSERSLSEQEVRTALRKAADVLGPLRCHSCGQSFQAYMSYYVHRGRCQGAPKKPPGQQAEPEGAGQEEQKTPRGRPRKQEPKTPEAAAEGGERPQGPGMPRRRGRPPKGSGGLEQKTSEGTGRQSKERERETPEPKTPQPRAKRSRGPEKEALEQKTPEPSGKQPKGRASEGQEPETLKGRRKRCRDEERQTPEPRTPQPRAKRLRGREQETPEPGAKHPRAADQHEEQQQEPGCRFESAVPVEGRPRRRTSSRRASSHTEEEEEEEAAAPSLASPGLLLEEEEDPFVCSACEGSFPDMATAKVHILRAHYNLARVNDKRPLSEEEVVAALSSLQRRVRRFDCAQPACTHRSWRPVDFLQHLAECGPYQGVVTEATVKRFRAKDAEKKPQGHPQRAGRRALATPSPTGRKPKRTPLYRLRLDFPEGTPLVCSTCRESFTCKDAIAKHILEAHYNLARVNDEEPLTLEEMRSALRLASFQVSRFACPEPKCGVSFASYMSYYTHLKSCGPFQQLFESDSEDEDEELFRRPRQSNGTSASGRASAGGRERGRRSSALRALASFRQLDSAAAVAEGPTEVCQDDSDFDPSHGEEEERGQEEEEEEEGEEEKELAQEEEAGRGGEEVRRVSSKVVLERAWQGRFEGPRQDVVVDGLLVDSWNEALLRATSVPCPNKGCMKQFTTRTGLKYHYPRCMVHQLYRCLKCSAAFQRPRSLLQHLRRCYPDRPEGDPVAEEQAPPPPSSRSPSSSKRSRGGRRARPASSPVPSRQRQSASQACCTQRLPALLASTRKPVVTRLIQHMQHLQANVHSWQETLFPDWMPSGWRLLDEQEAESRLPKFRESPCIKSFRFGAKGKGQQLPWERLPLFGSCVPSGRDCCHLTFYPGGAVWASAWCPMAPGPGEHHKPAAQSPMRRQWVALACCPDPDLEHPLTETSSEPGLIQIWDLGTLNLKRGPGEREEEGGCPPRLALCLAHNFGFVTDLAWCPSGCCQEGRLGLLAAACGDGYARILSIPFPDALGSAPPEGRWPLYSTDGRCSLRLGVPPGSLGLVPCTRVAWDIAKGHGRMAAGYADGRVGLFQLAAEPLQQQLAGTGEGEREACWMWQAHQAAITGVGFTPQGHLATASLDHSTRMWDLERPGPVPLSSFSKGPVRHMALSPHWNGTFVVGEEIVTNGPALSVFRENGYYGFPPKSLAAHGTTVLSVAVSPWTNAVASCDASGEVGAIVLPCLSQSLDLMKHHNHSRLPLYRTLLVALNEDEEDGQRQPAGKKRPLARPGPPQHGGHAVANRDFGLCFEDVPLPRDGPVPQQALERVVNFKGMLSRTSNQYRLASLNTVCWSPNLGAANWLLSAGQAGVARLSWLGVLSKRLLSKGNS